MKNGRDFTAGIIAKIMSSANTGALAKVVKYANGRADVELYPDGDLLQNVPVATIQSADFIVRMPLVKGDIVAVLFSQHEIDGPLSGSEVESDRQKDINDAIIIGSIGTDGSAFPSAEPDSLMIGTRDAGAYLLIRKNKSAEIKATGGLTINAPGGFHVNGQSSNESW